MTACEVLFQKSIPLPWFFLSPHLLVQLLQLSFFSSGSHRVPPNKLLISLLKLESNSNLWEHNKRLPDTACNHYAESNLMAHLLFIILFFIIV